MSLRSTLCTVSGCKLRVAPAVSVSFTRNTQLNLPRRQVYQTMQQEFSLLAVVETHGGYSPLLKTTDSIRGELCFVLSVILQVFISY
jgi:hypothetical protein